MRNLNDSYDRLLRQGVISLNLEGMLKASLMCIKLALENQESKSYDLDMIYVVRSPKSLTSNEATSLIMMTLTPSMEREEMEANTKGGDGIGELSNLQSNVGDELDKDVIQTCSNFEMSSS